MGKSFKMQNNYLFVPIFGYLIAGLIKFLINSYKIKRWAFYKIGLGGMPSTHNTITASTFFSLGFGEGFYAPSTALAFTLAIIVAIDSMDLRKKLEQHARIIVAELANKNKSSTKVRTKLGHSPSEVITAWVLGAIIGYSFSQL